MQFNWSCRCAKGCDENSNDKWTVNWNVNWDENGNESFASLSLALELEKGCRQFESYCGSQQGWGLMTKAANETWFTGSCSDHVTKSRESRVKYLPLAVGDVASETMDCVT